MKNIPIITVGKLISFAIKKGNLGNGSTWPGHIALQTNKNFIRDILANSKIKIIFIVGTNGKTTTTSLIRHILEQSGKKVIQNNSGANLLNGIASTLILNTSPFGKINADIALFEIDENVFSLVSKEIKPDFIIMLNLFRDQLDRYGEVTSIATKWKTALTSLPDSTTLILNADDPLIASLGDESSKKIQYFGLDGSKNLQENHEHAVDSIYCPRCGNKLTYDKIFYSHLGEWECKKCNLRRPEIVFNNSNFYPLEGTYNESNTHAAILTAQALNTPHSVIDKALKSFTPAFGRQEMMEFKGKKLKIMLVKNPTGFNESIRTVQRLGGRHFLFILNDRVADGKDVSWIWDVDFELLKNQKKTFISISGDRVYDLETRLKYAELKNSVTYVENDLHKSITNAIMNISEDEILYILPTYTAMLDVRKVITGKKIL